MKKIAIILALAGIFSTSYGQGYVSVTGTFANSTNTLLLNPTYTGGQVNVGVFGTLGATTTTQAYTLALLTTTAGSPFTALFGGGAANNVWTNTGPQGANNTFAGRLVIGADYLLSGAAIGNSQQWMLFAWSTSLGSFATVWQQLAAGAFTGNGYIGWSPVVTGAAGAAPSALPLVISGSPSPLLTVGFTLEQVVAAPVPEPGTMALAGLGGLSLLAFRRKK